MLDFGSPDLAYISCAWMTVEMVTHATRKEARSTAEAALIRPTLHTSVQRVVFALSNQRRYVRNNVDGCIASYLRQVRREANAAL